MYDFAEDPTAPPGSSPGGGGIAGALAVAAASAYDSYQSSKTAKRNTDKTIAANQAQADLAYQRSVEQWNAQNVYNSPAAQMARFKAAGLSPHLVYGQGNAGNASNAPAYHPPNIQYQYEAGKYGQSVASMLPMMMTVGTWLQDMRLGEKRIQAIDSSMNKTSVDVDRLRQLISYAEGANPQMLRALQNKNDLFQYQKSAAEIGAETGWRKLVDLAQEVEHKHGFDVSQGLFSDIGYLGERGHSLRKEQLKQAIEKTAQERSSTKIKEAQASWSEFDITNPQQIMMLVMNGVLSMAGASMKLGKGGKVTEKPVKRERPRGVNRRRMSRNHPDR